MSKKDEKYDPYYGEPFIRITQVGPKKWESEVWHGDMRVRWSGSFRSDRRALYWAKRDLKDYNEERNYPIHMTDTKASSESRRGTKKAERKAKKVTAYEWGMGLVVKGLRRRGSFTTLTSSKEAFKAFDRGPRVYSHRFR